MNIAFCSSEVFPFAKTGGLGDVCGALPKALAQLGHRIAVIMPGYRCIGQSGMAIEQLDEQTSRSRFGSDINVYFVDHKKYFDRQGLYGDGKRDFPDNLDRFSYFCRQALTVLKQIDFQPDIVHCHDWQTALIPVYVKEEYGEDGYYARTKTVLSIHNLAFQGVFPKSQYTKIGLEERLLSQKGFEIYDRINLMKAGIIFSDAVTTVSPQYSKEIQTKEFGCGLEKVIHGRHDRVSGILNGIDYQIWDPNTDPHISSPFSKENLNEGKKLNKAHLQKELGFKTAEHVPLFGFVGRLSHQKGIDTIIDILGELVTEDVQIAFLGLGEKKYQNALRKIASRYPEKVSLTTTFNEPLGHRIYAGSDFFLMPSRFEPCGLSQMISLTYGTVPIVFKTGGLADTVIPYGPFCPKGNGIMFSKYRASELLKAVEKAIKIYRQPGKFENLRTNAIDSCFTWEHSAKLYQDVYQCV